MLAGRLVNYLLSLSTGVFFVKSLVFHKGWFRMWETRDKDVHCECLAWVTVTIFLVMFIGNVW